MGQQVGNKKMGQGTKVVEWLEPDPCHRELADGTGKVEGARSQFMLGRFLVCMLVEGLKLPIMSQLKSLSLSPSLPKRFTSVLAERGKIRQSWGSEGPERLRSFH